jgi:hypothetical protein
MFSTYKNPVYDYAKSRDQQSTAPVHHPLVIVGAGPVGMAAAIDARSQGVDGIKGSESLIIKIKGLARELPVVCSRASPLLLRDSMWIQRSVFP